jgi:hypothetical protein
MIFMADIGGLGGTCHDYVRAYEEGQKKGLSDKEIDRRYNAEHEMYQKYILPLLKKTAKKRKHRRLNVGDVI